MAKSQTAFLGRVQVPNRQALQNAIKDLKLKLTIDDAYVPFECAGYIPCTLDGEDAGFEIRFGDSAAHLSDAPHLHALVGDRDAALVFRWGGDARERVSAMIVCAALAQSFGALVRRQGEDAFRTAEQLFDEARKEFAQLEEY